MSFISGLLIGGVVVFIVFCYLEWTERRDATEDYRNKLGK